MEQKYTMANHDFSKRMLEVFASRGDAPLMLDVRTGRTIHYTEALDASLRLASYLAAKGAKKGAPVVFSADNCLELPLLYLACMHLGAPILPINPALPAADFEQLLSLSRSRLVVASSDVLRRKTGLSESGGGREIIRFAATGDDDAMGEEREGIKLDTVIQNETPFKNAFGAAYDDTLLLMPTSGTSGTPKILDLSYHSLFGNGTMFSDAMGIDHDNRFYNILPMTYLGGIYNLFLIPLLNGGSLAINAPFGGAMMYGFWDDVHAHGVNTLWFTSAMLSLLLAVDKGSDADFPKDAIRLSLVGMAPLTPETKDAFEKRFGLTLFENYALSETLFLTSERPGRARKPGCSGPMLPGITLEIVDAGGQTLPKGGEGEIRIRTPYRIRDYYLAGDEDRDKLLPDNGMLTGDVGRLDDDDELFVTGRVKDLIIRGGVNISPKQIEGVLSLHPAVMEAAVVGIPDTIYGEEVAAAVSLRNGAMVTEKELQHFCTDRLPPFHIPKRVLFMRELPKGGSGKVLKREIKGMF